MSPTATSLRALRNRAIILLGFAGAFRRSELVALNVEDLLPEVLTWDAERARWRGDHGGLTWARIVSKPLDRNISRRQIGFGQDPARPRELPQFERIDLAHGHAGRRARRA